MVLPQANAYAMIGRRAAAAGIATKLGNHTLARVASRQTVNLDNIFYRALIWAGAAC